MAEADGGVRSPGTSVLAQLAGSVRSAMRTIGRRDVAVSAAQLTYFGGIAIVPWLLLACWTTTWFAGAASAESRLLDLQVLVPPDMGARAPFRALVSAGVQLGVVGALATVVPATFYGEGIRRGCLSLLPEQDRLTGWRARLWMLPILVLVVPLALAAVHLSAGAVDLAQRDGPGPHLVRIVVTFTLTWLVLTVPLAWVYHYVAPGRLPWTSALAGALATASFLAGFLQGFLLFLSIPVDVGIPFGGLDAVGGVVAVGFWLYLLHIIVLVGWVVTVVVDGRLRGQRARS